MQAACRSTGCNPLAMTCSDSPHPAFSEQVPDLSFKTERQIVHQALQRERAAQDEVLARLLSMEPGLDAAAPFADVILAVGLPRQDTVSHRTARCQLAIALETLAQAQRIHRLEMGAESPSDLYLAGTVVLMGDHHFARAAQLVTQLANPALLEAFARVLKITSTQEVASLMAESQQELPTRAAITTCGIQCGAFLPDIDPAEVERTAAAWKALATPAQSISAEAALAAFLAEVPSHQRGRWRIAATEYLAQPAESGL